MGLGGAETSRGRGLVACGRGGEPDGPGTEAPPEELGRPPLWAWPVVDLARSRYLELVGGVEGDLAHFGEAVPVPHGVAQCQLRELEQRSLRGVSDHDALGTGSSEGRSPRHQAPDSSGIPRPLTLGTGTASWPDLKAARLHRVSTRHSARHVSEDWSNVCPGDQTSGLGPRWNGSPKPEPSRSYCIWAEPSPLPRRGQYPTAFSCPRTAFSKHHTEGFLQTGLRSRTCPSQVQDLPPRANASVLAPSPASPTPDWSSVVSAVWMWLSNHR